MPQTQSQTRVLHHPTRRSTASCRHAPIFTLYDFSPLLDQERSRSRRKPKIEGPIKPDVRARRHLRKWSARVRLLWPLIALGRSDRYRRISGNISNACGGPFDLRWVVYSAARGRVWMNNVGRRGYYDGGGKRVLNVVRTWKIWIICIKFYDEYL